MNSTKVEIDEDLYEVLGVERSASKAEIKKAYHKAALSSHPDKVSASDRETAEIRFKSVSRAYEILSDDDARQMYDVGGFDPRTGGPAGGFEAEMDAEEMMARMFAQMGMGGGSFPFGGPGSGTPGQKTKKRRKGKDQVDDYEVSLEELYKGKTTRFAATKTIICAHCKGLGGKEKAKKIQCGTCRGQGQVRGVASMGDYITTQMHKCGNCNGDGQVYKDKDKCRKCHGARTTTTKKFLELYIPPGARAGDKIVLAGEADQSPDDLEPGDLVFVVQENNHETFQRRGNDLCADFTVTLAEALTGFDRTVLTHLDGRGISLKISQPKGKVLRPGQVLKISGEGMPVKKTDSRGDLYLIVKVEFPDDGWIKDDKVVSSIRSVLPPPGLSIETEVVDERDFELSSLDEFLQAGGDDGEDGEGWEDEEGEGVPQCAQQ